MRYSVGSGRGPRCNSRYTCCGMAAATPWPTPATTHGRYRLGSATRTSSICIIPPHGGAYLMPANYGDGVEPEATRRSKFSGWCSPVTGSRTNGKAAHALADDEPHLRSLDSALNPKDLRKKRSRTFKRRRVCSRKHWVAPTMPNKLGSNDPIQKVAFEFVVQERGRQPTSGFAEARDIVPQRLRRWDRRAALSHQNSAPLRMDNEHAQQALRSCVQNGLVDMVVGEAVTDDDESGVWQRQIIQELLPVPAQDGKPVDGGHLRGADNEHRRSVARFPLAEPCSLKYGCILRFRRLSPVGCHFERTRSNSIGAFGGRTSRMPGIS